MSAKHLNLDPHQIDGHAWWYEEPDGITVVIEFRDKDGKYLGTEQRKLAWGSIRAALRRRDFVDWRNRRNKVAASDRQHRSHVSEGEPEEHGE